MDLLSIIRNFRLITMRDGLPHTLGIIVWWVCSTAEGSGRGLCSRVFCVKGIRACQPYEE